ncbi:MAG: hypothetical protein EA396_09260 [Anaerolineaceae bacterium]|nr:MAG: hypothetical protein EA396_09260 [Anaerolineaceae bacterium]
MNHRQTVIAVARRLPHLERHTVAEVLEVTGEIWAAELAKPHSTVTVINLGKLYVEAQQMQVGGAVRNKLQTQHGTAPNKIRRIYYRFRPSGWLKELIEETHEETQKD